MRLAPPGPPADRLDRERVLEILRRQGVTVVVDVETGSARLRRGGALIVEYLPDRVPNTVLRALARKFEFDFLRFYFDVVEEDLDPPPDDDGTSG